MNCRDYRDGLAAHLTDPAEPAGAHAAACPDCARHLDLARAAWEVAGKWPDESVPADVFEKIQRFGRRPRGFDLTLLRPVALAAAALLAAGLWILLRPSPPPGTDGALYEGDGMLVKEYPLRAGVDAGAVAKELRRTVSPEAWGEGGSAVEVGPGWLRILAPGDVQRAVQSFLARYR